MRLYIVPLWEGFALPACTNNQKSYEKSHHCDTCGMRADSNRLPHLMFSLSSVMAAPSAPLPSAGLSRLSIGNYVWYMYIRRITAALWPEEDSNLHLSGFRPCGRYATSLLMKNSDVVLSCASLRWCQGRESNPLSQTSHPVRSSAPLRPSLAGSGWTSRPSRAICCVFVLNRWSPPSFFAPGTRANKYRASKGLR